MICSKFSVLSLLPKSCWNRNSLSRSFIRGGGGTGGATHRRRGNLSGHEAGGVKDLDNKRNEIAERNRKLFGLD